MTSPRLLSHLQGLKISSKALSGIREAAASAYPRECCGILAGETYPDEALEYGHCISGIYCMKNREKDSAEVYYRIDPKELFRAELAAEKNGEAIIGVYHSHTEHEAVLSADDEEFMIPGMIYLIIPVYAKEPGKIRAYIRRSPDESAVEIAVETEE